MCTFLLQFNFLKWSREHCSAIPQYHIRKIFTQEKLTCSLMSQHLWLKTATELEPVCFGSTPLTFSSGWKGSWWNPLDLCKRSDPRYIFWEGFPNSVSMLDNGWAAKDLCVYLFLYFIYLFLLLIPSRDADFRSYAFHQPLTQALSKVRQSRK